MRSIDGTTPTFNFNALEAAVATSPMTVGHVNDLSHLLNAKIAYAVEKYDIANPSMLSASTKDFTECDLIVYTVPGGPLHAAAVIHEDEDSAHG